MVKEPSIGSLGGKNLATVDFSAMPIGVKWILGILFSSSSIVSIPVGEGSNNSIFTLNRETSAFSKEISFPTPAEYIIEFLLRYDVKMCQEFILPMLSMPTNLLQKKESNAFLANKRIEQYGFRKLPLKLSLHCAHIPYPSKQKPGRTYHLAQPRSPRLPSQVESLQQNIWGNCNLAEQ